MDPGQDCSGSHLHIPCSGIRAQLPSISQSLVLIQTNKICSSYVVDSIMLLLFTFSGVLRLSQRCRHERGCYSDSGFPTGNLGQIWRWNFLSLGEPSISFPTKAFSLREANNRGQDDQRHLDSKWKSKNNWWWRDGRYQSKTIKSLHFGASGLMIDTAGGYSGAGAELDGSLFAGATSRFNRDPRPKRELDPLWPTAYHGAFTDPIQLQNLETQGLKTLELKVFHITRNLISWRPTIKIMKQTSQMIRWNIGFWGTGLSLHADFSSSSSLWLYHIIRTIERCS